MWFRTGSTPTTDVDQPPKTTHPIAQWMEDLSYDIFISTDQPIRGCGAEVYFNTSAVCLRCLFALPQHAIHNVADFWTIASMVTVPRKMFSNPHH